MGNRGLTEVQKKALATMAFGLVFLLFPDSQLGIANRVLGIVVAIVGILSYIHDKQKENMSRYDKIGSAVVTGALILFGTSVLIGTRFITKTVTLISGVILTAVGGRDIFCSKEPVYSWLGLAFAVVGIVIILYPYTISTAPIHIAGVVIIYQGIKTFLGEIYG